MRAIQTYTRGLSGILCENPKVRLSIGQNPALPGEPVLIVEYPASTDDPTARDIWCDADDHDWSSGRAIAFQVKPDQPLTLSVSFMGANGVAYTAWFNLSGGEWQTVQIPFAEIEPNPYFQPPGANTDSPIDVSDVEQLGFAPQSADAGRMLVSKILVVS